MVDFLGARQRGLQNRLILEEERGLRSSREMQGEKRKELLASAEKARNKQRFLSGVGSNLGKLGINDRGAGSLYESTRLKAAEKGYLTEVDNLIKDYSQAELDDFKRKNDIVSNLSASIISGGIENLSRSIDSAIQITTSKGGPQSEGILAELQKYKAMADTDPKGAWAGIQQVQNESITNDQIANNRFKAEELRLKEIELQKDVEKPIGDLDPILTEGLSPKLAAQVNAGYKAAGGSDEGMKEVAKIIDRGTESERRESAPKLILESYPEASPAELKQLQAKMDGSKTVSEGLKAADGIREKQKRLIKAKGFQIKAVELLDNLLNSDSLNDVVGPIEGTIDKRFDEDEVNLIADIEEAQNILTAENMDLMTGVLSESDILLLKSLSSGALNRKRSEKRFRKDVKQLRDKLNSQLVRTVDDEAGDSVKNLSDEDLFN